MLNKGTKASLWRVGGGGTVDRLNKRTNTLMWWCGDVNRQTCWTKKPMGLEGDCRQAKQKDKHLVVVVWGCQQVNMLNKEASGVGGGGGRGLTTSRHAEQRGQYLVVAGGWGVGGCQPADLLNKEASTLLWQGVGGDCQQLDMLNKGQYLVVVGVPTSKLNKEASTLLWWGCQQAS